MYAWLFLFVCMCMSVRLSCCLVQTTRFLCFHFSCCWFHLLLDFIYKDHATELDDLLPLTSSSFVCNIISHTGVSIYAVFSLIVLTGFLFEGVSSFATVLPLISPATLIAKHALTPRSNLALFIRVHSTLTQRTTVGHYLFSFFLFLK